MVYIQFKVMFYYKGLLPELVLSFLHGDMAIFLVPTYLPLSIGYMVGGGVGVPWVGVRGALRVQKE